MCLGSSPSRLKLRCEHDLEFTRPENKCSKTFRVSRLWLRQQRVRSAVYNRTISASVDLREAETQFLKLLERVALGEEIIIARAGKPLAKLSPLAPRRARTPGGAEGLNVPESSFEPLPEEFMRCLK